jgi:class 3 adenylate cyclase
MLIPLAALWLLIAQPAADLRWEHHGAHFWLVLATAIVNVGLAAVVAYSAARRGDGRLFLVAVGFMVSAGFLGLHSLATPGVLIHQRTSGFVAATPTGLLLASGFAVLSSLEFSEAGARRLRRAGVPLLVAVGLVLVGWGLLSLSELPPLDTPLSDSEASGVLLIAAFAGAALYGVASLRFFRLHRRRPAVMLVSLITAFALLAEAMFAVAYGRSWHASWWEWHVLMTAAFALVAYSAYVQYRREGSPVGLFYGAALEATVQRLRRDYSQALEELVAAVQRRADATEPVEETFDRTAATVASQFDLTERQLDVLKRSADALGRERRQARRLGALVAVGQQARVMQEERALASRAMDLAAEAFRPLRLRLALIRDGVLTFPFGDGSAVTDGLCQDALHEGEPVASPDARSFAVPLHVKDHRVGVLEARDEHRPIGGADQAILRSFAAQLSIALENSRLYHSLDGLFRSYMSPPVATSLIADPEQARLGGDIVEVTVLMADLRGFTPFAERTPPDEVVAMLNAYYGVVVPAILAEGGTVIQFVGDAVMAIFNSPVRQPDHARRAARAALALQRAVDAVRAGHAGWPPFRVGVNSGPALVGNIGSAELRNFTAIGDTTNLAARLESIAAPGQVVIGSATRALLGDHAVVEPLGSLTIRGKAQPVEAFVLKSAE